MACEFPQRCGNLVNCYTFVSHLLCLHYLPLLHKIQKILRWVSVGECFFWYWPTRVVPDEGPLNGWVCVSGMPVNSVAHDQQYYNSSFTLLMLLTSFRPSNWTENSKSVVTYCYVQASYSMCRSRTQYCRCNRVLLLQLTMHRCGCSYDNSLV